MVLPALLLAAAGGQSAGTTALLLAVVLALTLLELAAVWRLFTKAGERGWKSLIPIYSTIILLRIVGRPWWWLLPLAIPIIDIIFLVIVFYDLSKAFGHGLLYAVGLMLLPGIMIPLLAFGGSRYYGPGGVLSTVSPRLLERSGAPGWGGTGGSSRDYDGNWARGGGSQGYDGNWSQGSRAPGYDWGGAGGSGGSGSLPAYGGYQAGGYQAGGAYGSGSQGSSGAESGYSPGVSAAQTASTSPPSWHPDPRGRHELRYWDGNEWTEHVADAGAQGTDPV